MKTKLCGILLVAAGAWAQENYSSWAHYKTITINTTADTVNGAANVNASVTNFPVLVRLTAVQTDVFTQAAANGTDIRFITSNGATRLKHQRERWDGVNHLAEFWVLVPGIAGNALTTLRMYWGKSAAADSSNGAAVYDTSNGFRAVWHMNGGVGNERDVTVDTLLATNTGAPTSNASGAVGLARSFDGAAQYFTVLNSATGVLNFHLTDNFTVSAWVFAATVPAVANSGMVILNKGDNQWTFETQDNAATPKYWVVEARGNNAFLNARSTGLTGSPVVTSNSSVGSWHHLMGTYKGAAVNGAIAETLFYDGNPVATLAAVNMNNNGRNENYNVFIGALPSNTSPPNGASVSRFWNGSLDELSVSKIVRSSAWVKLCYQTQKPGANAVSLGASLVPTALAPFVSKSSFVIQQTGSSVVFHFPTQPGGVEISIVDAMGHKVWGGKVKPGISECIWDPKTGARPAKAGVYFVRIAASPSLYSFSR